MSVRTSRRPGWGRPYSANCTPSTAGPIYYLCLRLLSDPEKAQDATHDVFLKAFRKMDQFRGESSWRTWLYRIAINHCRNLQAAWHERHMLSNADEALWETTPAQTDSPLRVLETKELGAAHSEGAGWAAPRVSAAAAAGRRRSN